MLQRLSNERGKDGDYFILVQVEDHSCRRRRSFPNQKDLLVNKSETELRAEAGQGHTPGGAQYWPLIGPVQGGILASDWLSGGYTRGHARARSDTGVVSHQDSGHLSWRIISRWGHAHNSVL